MNFGDDSTGFGIEWSGNDTATRKLFSNLRIGSNWLPFDNTYSLGSSDYKWKDLYLSGNITIAGTVDGTDISAHVSNANAHHSSTSNELTITPTKVNINSPAGTTAALNVNGEFHLYTGSINIKALSGSIAWADSAGFSRNTSGGFSNVFVHKNFFPSSDNALTCGGTSFRWSDLRTVLINGTADVCFENKWTLTEHYMIGIKEPGIAILDENNNLQMFIGKKYLYTNKLKDIRELQYVKTTQKERSRMASKRSKKQ